MDNSKEAAQSAWEKFKAENKDTLIQIDMATTDEDWSKLNPNSLETDCRDCGEYYTKEWQENEQPPANLICPKCGSNNHGSVGSPAGATHLALHDPRLA